MNIDKKFETVGRIVNLFEQVEKDIPQNIAMEVTIHAAYTNCLKEDNYYISGTRIINEIDEVDVENLATGFHDYISNFDVWDYQIIELYVAVRFVNGTVFKIYTE